MGQTKNPPQDDKTLNYEIDYNSRIEFMMHQEHQIMVINYSFSSEETFISILEVGSSVISQHDKNSLLVLSDFTGAIINPKFLYFIKCHLKFNAPYIKASAIIGLNTLQEILLNSLLKFTDRKLKSFSSKEKALEWLIKAE